MPSTDHPLSHSSATLRVGADRTEAGVCAGGWDPAGLAPSSSAAGTPIARSSFSSTDFMEFTKLAVSLVNIFTAAQRPRGRRYVRVCICYTRTCHLGPISPLIAPTSNKVAPKMAEVAAKRLEGAAHRADDELLCLACGGWHARETFVESVDACVLRQLNELCEELGVDPRPFLQFAFNPARSPSRPARTAAPASSATASPARKRPSVANQSPRAVRPRTEPSSLQDADGDETQPVPRRQRSQSPLVHSQMPPPAAERTGTTTPTASVHRIPRAEAPVQPALAPPSPATPGGANVRRFSAAQTADPRSPGARRARRIGWTPSENAALMEGVQRFGSGSWSAILNGMGGRFHPKRTAGDLKDRWRNMKHSH